MNWLKRRIREHWLGMVIGVPFGVLCMALTVWLPYMVAFGWWAEPTPFYFGWFCLFAIVYGLVGEAVGARAEKAIRARRARRRR
ncbi:hypothetical protein AB0425_17440 [Actinosynnema sp. NPDC051121]